MNDPMKHFPDPDNVCQMEYRAIHTHMKEVLDDCPEDERFELALSMLEEFKSWAENLKENLLSSEKTF